MVRLTSSTATLAPSAPATREDISALFSRVAFGATAAQLDEWTGRPYHEAVEHLLDVPPAGPLRTQPDDAVLASLNAWGGVTDNGATPKLELIQAWWLERMRTTRWPLLERMTLFWHGHWATAYGPYPDAAMMLAQNESLRQHALGSFRSMANAMNTDPAMLHWLNGDGSSAPKPNENYAREFFELFTLGKHPQVYTEQDVREAARAFTGWTSNPTLRTSVFTPQAHDRGAKRVLGVRITDMGDREHTALTDIALAQTVAAEFLAKKMVAEFAYVPAANDPLVAKVAAALRGSDYDLESGMRALLLADEFRRADRAAGRQLVRPPVDLAVAGAKALGLPLTGSVYALLAGVLARMGQRPFEPPNVAGWPQGLDWLSPATMIARYDLPFILFASREVSGPPYVALPHSSDLASWAAKFGLAGFTPSTEQAIRDHLDTQLANGFSEEVRQLGVLALVMTSPDWMVV